MEIIRKQAFARAGLIGNPSDGYNGRTISITVGNFRARVFAYEWEDLEIVLTAEDQTRFDSIGELASDVGSHGYYGGARLVKATIKRFFDFCRDTGLCLHNRNFSIRYETDIPKQVGLAGSSAIIVGTLRCLMEFYDIDIPLHLQPSLVLEVETDELHIPAGLQDRDIQVYEGAMYMDFSKEKMREEAGLCYGQYSRLDVELPPLYVAYSTRFSEPTEVVHNDLRERFHRGDPEVVDAMRRFADLTLEAREAILIGDSDRLAALLNENFDLRRSITHLPEGHLRMVEVAREAGASAKFAGSGGAIIGTYADEKMFERLRGALGDIGCRVIKPQIRRGEESCSPRPSP